MALERIEWSCPDCGKRFAIPASAEMPTRCPTCQQAATQKETPTVISPPPPLPDVGESAPVEMDAPSIAVPVAKRSSAANRNLPRKYQALRTISLAWRILGGFIVALTLYLNIRASIFLASDGMRQSFKSTSSHVFTVIEVNLAILTFGAFWAVLALAVSEMIFLMIDIEENTRRSSE